MRNCYEIYSISFESSYAEYIGVTRVRKRTRIGASRLIFSYKAKAYDLESDYSNVTFRLR